MDRQKAEKLINDFRVNTLREYRQLQKKLGNTSFNWDNCLNEDGKPFTSICASPKDGRVHVFGRSRNGKNYEIDIYETTPPKN